MRKTVALIEVENLVKWFPVRKGLLATFFRRGEQLYIKAVDGVSFKVREGEIFGLAGESGCGKTTTARTMLRLTEPTGGKIYYRDTDLLTLTKKELNKIRRELQIVFQDPYESLNPRGFVSDIVSEPLSIQGIGGEEIKEIVARILKTVGLTPVEEFLYRYPHELSGGQRQRVAIARALILEPKFIVADEPVSMIDMSLRAGILNLMMDLRDKFNLSYLYITHDLAVTKYICDRLAIMYLGKVIEKGPAVKLIDEPLHPYARALMEAVPTPDPEAKIGKVPITGEVPTPINMPSGCRFHPRCPYAKSVCKKEEPQMVKIDRDRYVACHLLA